MSPSRDDLWRAYRDRQALDPRDRAALTSALEEDPAWARARLEERDFDALMAQHLREDDETFVALVRRSLDLDRDTSRFLHAVHGRLRRRRRSRWAWAIAAAALIVFGLAIPQFVSRDPIDTRSTVIGRLLMEAPRGGIRVHRQGEPVDLPPGADLAAGDVLVLNGDHPPLAIAHLHPRCTLTCAAPARLRLSGPSLIDLEQGWLRLDTHDGAARGEHVTVRTPHGRIHSEGTVFGVLTDDDQCLVAVESGRVRVSEDDWQRTLTAGTVLRWHGGRPTSLTLPASPLAGNETLSDLHRWSIDGDLPVTVQAADQAHIKLDHAGSDWRLAQLRSDRLGLPSHWIVDLHARIRAPITDDRCEFQVGILDHRGRGSLSIYGRYATGGEQDQISDIHVAHNTWMDLRLIASRRGATALLNGARLHGAYAPSTDRDQLALRLAWRARAMQTPRPAAIRDLRLTAFPDLRSLRFIEPLPTETP